MRNLLWAISLACTLFQLLPLPASATEPAVSQINGKTGVTLGSVDGDSLYVLDGSVTFPIGRPAGIQVDAGFGQWDADAPVGDVDITRLGLHLFARDPEIGMAGIYASLNELDNGTADYDINQYAIEAEFYSRLGDAPLTYSALLGQVNPDQGDNELLSTLDLSWYPLDELMIEIGAAIVDNDMKGHIGAEYQFLQSLTSYLALSAYADIAVGEGSYDHALLGIRAYFGSPKNLVTRHRNDSVGNSTDRLNPPLPQ